MTADQTAAGSQPPAQVSSSVMGINDQPAILVSSPSYPNSVAWSKDNLVAVASGNLISIINPASPVRPRGLITLQASKPFPIGVIDREELLNPCVMPLSLSHDVRGGVACARSISWSPPGFATNAGCLLAVCTVEGHVKLYRAPFREFRAEWVEVVDISELLYLYLKRINFQELKEPSTTFSQGELGKGTVSESPEHSETRMSSKRIQKKRYVDFEECGSPSDGDYSTQNNDDEHYDPTPSRQSKLTRKSGITHCTSFNRGSSHSPCDVDNRNAQNTDDEYNDPTPYKQRKMSRKPVLTSCTSSTRGSSDKKFGRQQSNGTEYSLQLITPQQYAARSMLLSSLIVSWSPVLESSGGNDLNAEYDFSILAVGGKSGTISFWRIHQPRSYTLEHGRVSVDPVVIGLLKAHNSWITAISWGFHGASSSESMLVLATGSSDGSVKIWSGDVKELVRSSEASNTPWSLLKEVTSVISSPVSTISLVVPPPFLDQLALAIGRGSGCLEVWSCNVSSSMIQTLGTYNAHNQMVTGLAWSFDGRCLYSCSQDNTVRSWVLSESSLLQAPFPANIHGQKDSVDLSPALDLCFGVALSPGGLVVAIVRSFDSGLLNQMYQRTMKAAVEFYWTGRQSLAVPPETLLVAGNGLSERESVCWESTVLCSLKHCDSGDEPIVLWDILMALLSLRKYVPDLFEKLLLKWLSGWSTGFQHSDSVEGILFHVQSMLQKLSTRRLHLLNIICRRVMLRESKLGDGQEGMQDSSGAECEQRMQWWNKLLVSSERELQERFMSFVFKAILKLASSSTAIPATRTNWSPAGIAQMERWVALKTDLVHNELKHLGSRVGQLRARICQICEYTGEENCSYCLAPVPFESELVARCKGTKHQDGSLETHELKRCAASMQVGSITSPTWYCMCCRRQYSHLSPSSFFAMSGYPLDVKDCDGESSPLQERPKPWCLFCGILLQKQLPEFLLSASPI